MSFNIARLFSFTRLIEANLLRLAEELAREREARRIEKQIFDKQLASERRDWQAKVDALTERMLYMAGVPEKALQAEQQEAKDETESSSILPGRRSIAFDEQSEQLEEEILHREWQRMQAALNAELKRESQDNLAE